MTECIGDHNDTNKRNNCLNLICALTYTIGYYRIKKSKS